MKANVDYDYKVPSRISGFRREVDENCAVLGYYAASSGDLVPTLRDNPSVPSSRIVSLEVT
jgi:hypothetical protein